MAHGKSAELAKIHPVTRLKKAMGMSMRPNRIAKGRHLKGDQLCLIIGEKRPHVQKMGRLQRKLQNAHKRGEHKNLAKDDHRKVNCRMCRG